MITLLNQYKSVQPDAVKTWFKAAKVSEFPRNGGACILYKGLQVAVFNFTRRNEWYACQNLCPHKKQMVLSRGMTGSVGDQPKVACPFHKKTFLLKSGKNPEGDTCDLATYPVKIQNDYVYIGFAE